MTDPTRNSTRDTPLPSTATGGAAGKNARMQYPVVISAQRTDQYIVTVEADSPEDAEEKVDAAIRGDSTPYRDIDCLAIDGKSVRMQFLVSIDGEFDLAAQTQLAKAVTRG